GVVQIHVIAIDHDDQPLGIGVEVNAAEDAAQGAEEGRDAMGLQIHADGLRRFTEDSRHENLQGRTVGGGFTVETDHHGFTDTPPRTPLYHTSLRGEFPRISWKCSMSVSRVIST